MNERLRSPLDVIVVARPDLTEWFGTAESGKWSFCDDLFRCLSYDIGSRQAANPAIPVYFSIGNFGPNAKSPPPLIDISRTERVIALVLLDAGYRAATSSWGEFFDAMRKSASGSSGGLLLIPFARADDGQLGMDIQRLGLGRVASVNLRAGDDRLRQPGAIRRYFRIAAMVAAIRALRSDPENQSSIEVFISYAKRDGVEFADRLQQAFDKYPGISAMVDSMAFSPGASIDVRRLEEKLAVSSCVVVCQTTWYSNRLWCRREALLATRSDVPMIVVDLREGLERVGSPALANCPHLAMKGGNDDDLGECVELAVSEILRIAHHRARSAAMLAQASIDPERVEVLARKPELIRLVDLASRNAEAVRQKRRPDEPMHKPKHLILHPDPPLHVHELDMLRMVDPNFRFLTPSTILIDKAATEEADG